LITLFHFCSIWYDASLGQWGHKLGISGLFPLWGGAKSEEFLIDQLKKILLLRNYMYVRKTKCMMM
jgi:hypothetical protein